MNWNPIQRLDDGRYQVDGYLAIFFGWVIGLLMGRFLHPF